MHSDRQKWVSLSTGCALNVISPNWLDCQYFVRNVHRPNCCATIPYLSATIIIGIMALLELKAQQTDESRKKKTKKKEKKIVMIAFNYLI